MPSDWGGVAAAALGCLDTGKRQIGIELCRVLDTNTSVVLPQIRVLFHLN